MLPKLPQHVEAAHVGQHDVEHHGVRAGAPGSADRGCPVGGRGDVPALVAQRHRHHLSEHRLVVDDEDVDRVSVGPAHHDAFGG